MNREELIKALNKLNIDPFYYSLEGHKREFAFNLEESYGKWTVYYFERGERSYEKTFDDEKKACEYIYDLIKNHSGLVK